MRRLLAAAVLTAAFAAAAPAGAAVPLGNLLVNPGAEAAAGATDSSTSLPLPGWTVTNGFTAVQYDTSGFLTAADATALGGGKNFFSGGPDSESSTALQTVNVNAAAGGAPQSANFYDGLFKVTQVGGITQLQLNEALTGCTSAKSASAAAKKPKTRKLWGDGAGSSRTKGSYSAATVRGTNWLVQDSCTSTLTRVTKGVVSVLDTVKHKTVLVKAGKRYTARKR